MMIRSARIPSVLNRICDDKISCALMVTADGELLGASNCQIPSTTTTTTPGETPQLPNPESLGTLVADIAMDYHRLGEEFTMLTAVDAYNTSNNNQLVAGKGSHLQCLLLEMDLGIIGVAACSNLDCLVMAVAKHDAPAGLIKSRLSALAAHVQESFSTLSEGGT